MAENFYSPKKIGLLIVATSYFLFTLHFLFTLSWIGEWRGLPGSLSFWIFLTDISGAFTLIFRFIAGLLAVGCLIVYFLKKGLPTTTKKKILCWVLGFEAVYWTGLFLSGVWGVLPPELAGTAGWRSVDRLGLLISTGIPCLVGSIGIPLALFKLVSKLKKNEVKKEVTKWGLIAGTLYILVFCLNNSGMWVYTLLDRGAEYILSYPENLVSFTVTTVGLPILLIFSATFSLKSIKIGIEKLPLKKVGIIITATGLYFLWNYLTWIFFGRPEIWSAWYAWLLGHNLDLWALSLPLLGLPLLFHEKRHRNFK